MSAAPAPSDLIKQKAAMSNTDEKPVNEFEDEWIKGEADAAAPNLESAAVIESARADAAKGDEEYLQAHTDLESQNQ